MAMWLDGFRSSWLAAALDLLWRQWTDLGVPGGLEETASWIIDPESLLISTVQFGRYDPRLLDAVLDWCTTNGNWLGSNRLQRLRKTLDPEAAQILSGIAGVLTEHDRSGKWSGLFGQGREGTVSTTPIPLFLLPDGKPLPMGTRSDPVFLKYGLLRPPWERRNLSSRVSATKPAVLRIRLRALFGVTSRAEILLFLLTHSRAHPSLVARQVHYAQPPVAKAMAEMAISGLLTEHRKGREVEYALDLGSDLPGAPRGLGVHPWDWGPRCHAGGSGVGTVAVRPADQSAAARKRSGSGVSRPDPRPAGGLC